jgi:hypothetical protein
LPVANPQSWKADEEFSTCLPAGRYDTSEKKDKVRRRELKKEKQYDRSEAKIWNAVCRL